MILEQITLKDLPMPPSANNLHATIWKTKRRVRTKEYNIYEQMMNLWASTHQVQLNNARQLTIALKKDQAIRVDRTYWFQRSSVLTKTGEPKRNDTSNRIKALDDSLSALLGIDDKYFWEGSFEKLIVPSGDHPGWVDVTLTIINIPA